MENIRFLQIRCMAYVQYIVSKQGLGQDNMNHWDLSIKI